MSDDQKLPEWPFSEPYDDYHKRRIFVLEAHLRAADEYVQHLWGCASWYVDEEGTRQIGETDCTCGLDNWRESLRRGGVLDE